MKVGDRVVVVDNSSMYFGREGEIVRAPGNTDRPPALPGFVEVRLDGHLAEGLFKIEEVKEVEHEA